MCKMCRNPNLLCIIEDVCSVDPVLPINVYMQEIQSVINKCLISGSTLLEAVLSYMQIKHEFNLLPYAVFSVPSSSGSTVWHPGCKNTTRTEERHRERVGIRPSLTPLSVTLSGLRASLCPALRTMIHQNR